MAKLILSMDGLVLKEIPLTKDRTTIGRRPSNDIQIDNLAISGEHAAVVTILNDSFLEDLNSTNGTLVNGLPVKKHFLKNGDVVELGKYKLKYIAEQATAGRRTDYEKTMVLRHGEMRQAPTVAVESVKSSVNPAVQSVAPVTPSAVGAIQLLNGANAGRTRAHQIVDDAGQAGRPGCGDCPAATGIFHHPRGRAYLSHREWSATGNAGASAGGSRRDSDRQTMEFFLKN